MQNPIDAQELIPIDPAGSSEEALILLIGVPHCLLGLFEAYRSGMQTSSAREVRTGLDVLGMDALALSAGSCPLRLHSR